MPDTLPPEAGIAVLDQHIALAEQRLLAREHDIRQTWDTLTEGVRQAVRPQRFLAPLLGAGLAGFITWWVRRGLAPAARPAAVVDHGRGGGLAWGDLMLIAWPLLPMRWRARISPATASGLIALVLPLIDHLRGKDSAPPPATVIGVDLARFAGTWFEIARLPAMLERGCAGQTSTTYTPSLNDASEVEVVNRCPTREGGERIARGVGHVVPDSGSAKFRVSLLPAGLRWLPLAWADHWILYLDRDYNVAMVGDPGRGWIRVLARAPELPEDDLQALLRLARDEGYAVDRLQAVARDPG